MSVLSSNLIRWHKKSGRKDLPWQIDTTPYKVWISEVMLQQTQVQTVIPYFLKFMHKFPNIDSLANSNENEVLSYWSGLGYYSRGRNLFKAAQIIQKDYGSNMPRQLDELESLPGIGRSTAGAICSLGFKLKAPILDGNAKRVLVRYFKIEDSIDLTKTVTELWKIAENNLPNKDCDIYTQAIMDVGSLICKRRNPDCHLCPLRKKCIAFKDSIQNNLPNKPPKKAKPIKKLYWLILRNRNGELLLENRSSKGVWEGLWTFIGFKESHSRKEYLEKLPKDFKVLEEGIKTQHVFTHYKLDIDTISIELNKDFKNLDNNKAWFNSDELTNIGLPAPVSKFLNIKK